MLGMCFCWKMSRCRIRHCYCCKCFLRCIRWDKFDDFDLMVLVHQVTFESAEQKLHTKVRLTAGEHHVETDVTANGIFQQPLNIVLEQGCRQIELDLMTKGGKVLASLTFDSREIINLDMSRNQPEVVHKMHQIKKKVNNPRIKLTMVVGTEGDAEAGIMASSSGNSDVKVLVRQQLNKAERDVHHGDGRDHGSDEMEILKAACSGPLEMFESLGRTSQVYMGVVGPPEHRHYTAGIWHNEKDFGDGSRPNIVIDMTRIESVQADPTRHHVFVINYFNEQRSRKSISFRRSDRARDVWVEILHLAITKVRELKNAENTRKKLPPSARSTQASW